MEFKKLQSLRILFLFIGFNFFSFNILSCDQEKDQTSQLSQGINFYNEEKYKEAFDVLKKEKDPLARQLCAHICLFESDGDPHALKETALYYLLASYGGNSDCYNYIYHSIPKIFELSKTLQLEKLVKFWILEESREKLHSIHVSSAKNYLIHGGYEMTKTMAQKLAYFFEKVSFALLYMDDIEGKSYFKKNKDSSPCGLSSPLKEKMTLTEHAIAGKAGALYPKYHKSLSSIKKGEFLPPSNSCPNIPVAYKFLLDALAIYTKGLKSKDLSQLCHKEIPWILQAISYWEQTYADKNLISTKSNEEIKNTLFSFNCDVENPEIKEVISVLEKEENSHIFPNKKLNTFEESKDKFHIYMYWFFKTTVSREHYLVENVLTNLKNRIETQDLSCKKKEEREIMKTPIMIFYIKNLTVRDISAQNSHKDCLKNILKYFFHLKKLSFYYTENFENKTSETKNQILHIVERFQERGFLKNS